MGTPAMLADGGWSAWECPQVSLRPVVAEQPAHRQALVGTEAQSRRRLKDSMRRVTQPVLVI